MPPFFFFLKEGAELAEGDGQEVDQQAHEEVPDDQQEEQDEYWLPSSLTAVTPFFLICENC